ncbi:MAG TPA: DUF3175 domain-containing protein [Methylomirabilota bacterium]|nr:DUF3175 domain-containing protein [Methylomirabilota bacterium]
MARAPKRGGRRWVRKVQQTSDALDLPAGIFKRSPRAIAQGLKRAATESRRRKGRTPFQSAMSMLNYHVNRGGRGLSRADRTRLEAAKRELRKAFGRPPAGGRPQRHRRAA